MDDPIPPSYTEAISRDWLPLVANYLDDSCLCSALRVSRKWHDVLAPRLWKDPAQHFGRNGEGFYSAFTRFQRSLPRVRPRVRHLTHTLHLTPSQNDFHDGPQPQWLREVLEYLPNLRCLVVSGIPFFDHNALSALESRFATHAEYPLVRKSTFPLRLLIAARCINCTYGKFEYTLQRFQRLVLLDLSRTPAARDDKVLSAIAALQDLQILKLRGIRLQDDDFKVLADPFNASHTNLPIPRRTFRLRSLDLRDNLLTDKSVGMLIGRMILTMPPSYGSQRYRQATSRARVHEPVESFRIASQAMQNLRGSDLDKQFVGLLARSDHADAVLQQLDDVGLTHLYLAGNAITDEGIVDLIETKRIHVLDIGDWQDAIHVRRPRIPDHLINHQNNAPITYGIKRIIQSFESNNCSSDLTYLRINHEIVTLSVQVGTQEPLRSGQAVSRQPQINEGHTRLSLKLPIVSLRPDSTTQSASSLPSYEQLDQDSVPSEFSEKSRTSTIESTEDKKMYNHIPLPPYTAESALSEQRNSRSSHLTAANLAEDPLASNSSADTAFTTTQSKIEQIIDRRQRLRRKDPTAYRRLLPGQLPNLETLVLTSIPRFTRSAQLIQNLRDFITDCAMEHFLATEQARLECNIQRNRKLSEDKFISQHAQQIFALRKIVLEVAPPRSREASEAEATLPSPQVFKAKTKSAVEDRDVDTFWEASKDDFSFFDEETDDLPGRENATTSTRQNTGSSYRSSNTSARFDPYDYRETPNADDIDAGLKPLRDVIAEIAAWRAERKKQYEAGFGHVLASEVWQGKIEVLSPSPNDTLRDADYYTEALG